MNRRVFLVVLDSFGIGEEPDAAAFGDVGANTLASIVQSSAFEARELGRLGLFNIEGVHCGSPCAAPQGAFARLQEASSGKDTTIGHWEIAGVRSPRPLPTYPDGFPPEVIDAFEAASGYKVLCNKPYSGTEVIRDYGEEHLATGALIVYTSADSVFQIAANEQKVPLGELYRVCGVARALLTGEHGVGRVIARPFVGDCRANFTRTPNRHDYSIAPPRPTMLNALSEAGREVIGVGKIHDIFCGSGLTRTIRTRGNTEGIAVLKELVRQDFDGLAFVNLVDFDMLYGHRRNIDGYAAATAEFDAALPELLDSLEKDDLLMITADHGCDPGFTKTTDHTREYVPWLCAGPGVREGADLGTLLGFDVIAATVCEYLKAAYSTEAGSRLAALLK